MCALLSSCGGSGEVTPHPSPAVVSTAPSEPAPTPSYPIATRDRLFFELVWANMSPEEKQATCQAIYGMDDEWLVAFLTSQNLDSTYDMRAQVILMKEKCGNESL